MKNYRLITPALFALGALFCVQEPLAAQFIQHDVVLCPSTGSGPDVCTSTKMRGHIVKIEYEKDGSNAYDAGVDFTITVDTTDVGSGGGLWTELNVDANKTVRPLVEGQDLVGVDNGVFDYVRVSGQRVRIQIDNGGASNTGQFTIYWEN